MAFHLRVTVFDLMVVRVATVKGEGEGEGKQRNRAETNYPANKTPTSGSFHNHTAVIGWGSRVLAHGATT